MKPVRHIASSLIALAVLAGAAIGGSEARAGVREASIAEGQAFEFSPFVFEVRFTERVQLVNARLVDQEGRETPLDLSFYRQHAEQFVIELPVLLPHGYRLSWRIRGASGPDQQGSVGFIVKGCVDPRAVTARAVMGASPVASPVASPRASSPRR